MIYIIYYSFLGVSCQGLHPCSHTPVTTLYWVHCIGTTRQLHTPYISSWFHRLRLIRRQPGDKDRLVWRIWLRAVGWGKKKVQHPISSECFWNTLNMALYCGGNFDSVPHLFVRFPLLTTWLLAKASSSRRIPQVGIPDTSCFHHHQSQLVLIDRLLQILQRPLGKGYNIASKTGDNSRLI